MKNEVFLPLAILGLTIAFGVICFLVYITGGTPTLIKKKMRIGALMLAFNAMVWVGNAQDDDGPLTCYVGTKRAIYVGPEVSYNRTITSLNPIQITNLSPENLFTDMSGNGYSVGFSYWIFFGNPYGSNHSVDISLNYKSISGSCSQLIADTTYYNKMIQSSNPNSKINFDNKYQISTLELKILYDYYFHGVCFTGGPDVEFTTGSNYYQQINVNETGGQKIRENLPGVTYEDNGRTAILYNDKIKRLNGINLNFEFGVNYEIITGTKVDFIPFLHYSIGLTNRVDYFDWKIKSIIAGVNIRFAI